jgi:hypothetical protein
VALGDQIELGAATSQNDRTLLAKLVDIRSANADDHEGSVTNDAFRDAGFNIEGSDPKQAGACPRTYNALWSQLSSMDCHA